MDPSARKADIAIRAYLWGEVVWIIVWAGTILALELTEQIGFDSDSKYELQGAISGLHAIATSGIVMVWRGERHWYVYLSLIPVMVTDTASILHLCYQVSEASWWSWVLCMFVSTYGLFLDVYALVCVIVVKDVLKISFDMKNPRKLKPSSSRYIR